jgi:hypothetical protein
MINKIGRRLYFEVATGNILVDTGEKIGYVRQTTVEEDIASYKVLSERNRNTFDYIELPYGAYAEDFMECNGYRVNPETKQLEFSYPDPNEPEPQEPVYRKPLSEELEETKQAIAELTLLIAQMGGM